MTVPGYGKLPMGLLLQGVAEQMDKDISVSREDRSVRTISFVRNTDFELGIDYRIHLQREKLS